MKPRDPTAADHVKPLAQQKTDFTAEGSPPPGKVASAEPVTPPAEPTKAAAAPKKPRGPARAPGTRNGPVPRRTHPR